MSRPNKRIVILGAGYGGIFFATNVARHIKEKTWEVILVDRNPYHQLLQEIHLVAAGFRTANDVKIPIITLIAGMNIKFIQSAVKQIRPDTNLVVLESTKFTMMFLLFVWVLLQSILILKEQKKIVYHYVLLVMHR